MIKCTHEKIHYSIVDCEDEMSEKVLIESNPIFVYFQKTSCMQI
jgi:hypothetical protein